MGLETLATEGVESASPAQGDNAAPPADGNQQPADNGVETLPFHKHPRWIAMNKSNKEMKEQIAGFESQQKELEGAIAVDRWLKEDPKGLLEFLKTQVKDEGSNPNVDPYANYEPEIAERFRRDDERFKEYDALVAQTKKDREAWQASQKERQQALIQENRAALDDEFDLLAKNAGFINPDGESDEGFMDVMAHATLAKLHSIAKNPEMPTKQELGSAFDAVVKGLKAVEKKALTQKVANPPASGSASGQIPTQRQPLTEEERIADLANFL